jgi:hypothetical protein
MLIDIQNTHTSYITKNLLKTISIHDNKWMLDISSSSSVFLIIYWRHTSGFMVHMTNGFCLQWKKIKSLFFLKFYCASNLFIFIDIPKLFSDTDDVFKQQLVGKERRWMLYPLALISFQFPFKMSNYKKKIKVIRVWRCCSRDVLRKGQGRTTSSKIFY